MDISAILSTALKPLWAKALAAVVLIAPIIVGGWIVINKNRDTKLVDTGREVGRTEAINAGHSTTLKQNKDAGDAEVEIRRGGDAAVDGCVSNARGDASGCERFR